LHHRQQFFVNVGNLEPPVLLAWTTLVSILCHIAQGVQGKYIACLLSVTVFGINIPIIANKNTDIYIGKVSYRNCQLFCINVGNFATPVLLALTTLGRGDRDMV